MNPPRALSSTEVVAIIRTAPRTREAVRDLAVAAVCLEAGPSRAELVAAGRADFDERHGLLALGAGSFRRVIRLGEFASSALLEAVPRQGGGSLLVARDGRPLTERAIHEQLLTIGTLAGLGHWVTVRHTRRTFIEAVAATHDLPVALRLAGHGGARHPAASIEVALRAQFAARWVSPLDRMLAAARSRAAA